MVERAGHIIIKPEDEWKHTEFHPHIERDNPIVIAGLRTFNGQDTTQVRIRDVSRKWFYAKLEEEQSKDPETKHLKEEEIDYIAFSPGIIKNLSGETIGEAGTVEVDQPDPHVWHRVAPAVSIEDPVAFVQMMSNNGHHPAHTRITDVGTETLERRQSFFFKIEEWKYLDQKHPNVEKIGYVILKSGLHQLRNPSGLGFTIIVGRKDNVTHQFSSEIVYFDPRINLHQPLKVRPFDMIVTQSQTFNGSDPIVTRMTITEDSLVRVCVQEEEAGGAHTGETIGYVTAQPMT